MFEGLDWDTLKSIKVPNRIMWLGTATLVAYVIWWYHGQYEKAHDKPVPKSTVITQQIRFLLDLLGH